MKENNKKFRFLLEKRVDEVKYIYLYNKKYLQIKSILLKRDNKKNIPSISSQKCIYPKTNFNNLLKNNNKLRNNQRKKPIINDLLLPLTINKIRKASSIRKSNSFNNNINCKTHNNLKKFTNNYLNSKILLSVQKTKKEKNKTISLSLLKHPKNNLNLIFNTTSPDTYGELLTKYKKDNNNKYKRNNTELKLGFLNIKYKTISNNNDGIINNKKRTNIFPNSKRFSLRNIIIAQNFHFEKRRNIQKNIIKEKKIDENKEINKNRALNIINNFRNNNKTANIKIQENGNFNEKINSLSNKVKDVNKNKDNNFSNKEDTHNNIHKKKKNCYKSLKKNSFNTIKNNKSVKNYLNEKFTRKKRDNNDIINLLNIEC